MKTAYIRYQYKRNQTSGVIETDREQDLKDILRKLPAENQTDTKEQDQ
jgi:hypothetical protein